MKDILIEFKYTIDEAVYASSECAKCTSQSILFMPWIGGITLLSCVVGNQFFGKTFLSMTPYIIIGIFLSAIPLTMRWSAKRNAVKLPNINKQVIWNINDIELSISNEGGETKFIWNQLIHIFERKKGFLLFSHPKIAQWIPKHGFKDESEIKLFREIAIDKTVFKKNNVSIQLIKTFRLYLAIAAMLLVFYYIFNTPSGGVH